MQYLRDTRPSLWPSLHKRQKENLKIKSQASWMTRAMSHMHARQPCMWCACPLTPMSGLHVVCPSSSRPCLACVWCAHLPHANVWRAYGPHIFLTPMSGLHVVHIFLMRMSGVHVVCTSSSRQCLAGMQGARSSYEHYMSLAAQHSEHSTHPEESAELLCDRCLQPIDEATFRANAWRLEASNNALHLCKQQHHCTHASIPSTWGSCQTWPANVHTDMDIAQLQWKRWLAVLSCGAASWWCSLGGVL